MGTWWKGRKFWQKAALVTLAALAALTVVGSFVAEEEPVGAAFTTPVEGCHGFWGMLNRSVRETPIPDDGVMHPRILAYEITYREVDPLQGSNLMDLREADSAAENSDAILVILRRCVAQGWPPPSQDEIAALVEAGTRVP